MDYGKNEGEFMSRKGKWGTIRLLPSGKYQASYVAPNRKRYNAPTTFAEKGRADIWLAEVKKQIELGVWEKPAKASAQKAMYFRDYAEKWLESLEVRGATKYMYDGWLGLHVLPYFGHIALDEITTPMVRDWYDRMPKGTETTKQCYSLLKRILEEASTPDDWGNKLIPENPCALRVKGVKSKREVEIVDEEDMQKLYSAMPDNMRLAIYVGGILGLRLSEVCGIKTERVDLKHKVLRVREQLKPLNGRGGELTLMLLKTAKSNRDVPIPDRLIPLFREHVKQYSSDMLFTNKGGFLAPASLAYHFTKAKNEIGRPNLHFHCLRHTAGTNIAAHSDIVTTMSILGHTNMDTAMIYQHAVDKRRVEALEKSSRYLDEPDEMDKEIRILQLEAELEALKGGRHVEQRI
jgi:integrase